MPIFTGGSRLSGSGSRFTSGASWSDRAASRDCPKMIASTTLIASASTSGRSVFFAPVSGSSSPTMSSTTVGITSLAE